MGFLCDAISLRLIKSLMEMGNLLRNSFRYDDVPHECRCVYDIWNNLYVSKNDD